MKTRGSHLVKVMPQPAIEDESSIATMMRQVIHELGEDTNRQGLLKTPERADKALRFLTSGYSSSLSDMRASSVNIWTPRRRPEIHEW